MKKRMTASHGIPDVTTGLLDFVAVSSFLIY